MKRLPSGAWVHYFDLDKKDDIIDIPGLRLNEMESCVTGSIDAVSAACVRLGAVPVTPDNAPATHLWGKPPGQLKDYQREGVSRLAGMLSRFGGALLADDMGLGKTRQAISLAVLTQRRRVVVVCPALARETWLAEIIKFGGFIHSHIALALPKADKRAEVMWELMPDANWVITSFELLPEVLKVVGQQLPDMLIVDEAHMINGRDTKRMKAVKDLADMVPFKLAISATPAWDRPRGYYQVLTIILGKLFGTGYEFDLTYSGAQQGTHGTVYGKVPPKMLAELKQRLSYYTIRREKRDVATELPPKSRQVVWLDPDEKARRAFQSVALRSGGVTVQHALEATLEAKIDAAIDLACQAKRFLLFTYRKDHARQMAEAISKRGVDCVLITGDIAPSARDALVKEATQRKCGVVATIDSAGQSLNLQGVCSYGIMHAIDYVPSKMAQAEDRIYRLGQKDPVQWIYLACRESMDALVIRTVVDKMDEQRAVLPSMKDATSLRDDLSAHEEGAAYDEQEALKKLYEAMKDEDEDA